MSETYFETFVRAVGACRDHDRILGDEGLVYPPAADFGYSATPRNAVTFGNMGVDGVHYALLSVDGTLDDAVPVIQIAPMDFSEPYSLLARSFLEYLAVGCAVSLDEMRQVFAAERAGQPSLVSYLQQHFAGDRLWDPGRNRSIDEYRDLLELKDF